LQKIGLPATYINSSISPIESNQRIQDIANGFYKIIYIAPERFYSQDFIELLKKIKVSLFAVDEAHCVSQWGHDFRPSYLRLKNVIKEIGSPTIMALTATATPEVKEDIIAQLEMSKPKIIVTGFARPNLQFATAHISTKLKPESLLNSLEAMREKSGIIYTNTRAKTEELNDLLNNNDYSSCAYHAGMDLTDRKNAQDKFMSGEKKVIIATNAFGMGIDKSDIRFVFHYDMPGTVEAYYQEAGRAGRDGLPSLCMMFFSSQDRYLQEFFIKGDNPSAEIIIEIYEILKNYDSDTVLATYSELSKMLPGDFPDMAIGTSIKILEQNGYLRRNKEKSSQSFVKFLAPPEQILSSIENRAKVKKRITEKLINKYINQLKIGWEINFLDLAEMIDEKKDSITRTIKHLADNDWVEYTPPFRGTEINILKRVAKEDLNINIKALKEKESHAYDKLNKIENYGYHQGCRQEYILKYFGETGNYRCKQCDNCLTGGTRLENKIQTKKNIHYRSKQKKEISFDIENIQPPKKNNPLITKLTQLDTLELLNKGFDKKKISEIRKLKENIISDHIVFLRKKGLWKKK